MASEILVEERRTKGTDGEDKGVLSLTEPDMRDIFAVKEQVREFTGALIVMNDVQRIQQLKTILGSQRRIMLKYGYDMYLKKYKPDGYSFNDVFFSIDESEGDIDFIRRACDVAFPIFENFLKELNVALPTYHIDYPKK